MSLAINLGIQDILPICVIVKGSINGLYLRALEKVAKLAFKHGRAVDYRLQEFSSVALLFLLNKK